MARNDEIIFIISLEKSVFYVFIIVDSERPSGCADY